MSDEQSGTLEAYASIPYRTGAWLHAAPARMGAIARLHGLSPAVPSRARVLELGCGNGMHLLPLAVAHPDAQFVGVDLAPGHVESGRKQAARLGVHNLRLESGSFTDLGEESGSFDYVIAHGLLSWIPASLQDALLAVAARHLAAEGVFFVSYNTFPGWHLRGAVRDMLAFQTRGVETLPERVARARALLAFLAEHTADDAPLAKTLREVARTAASEEQQHYFAHEYLEDENHPFFFADLIERGASHGLAYLANANWAERVVEQLPEDTLAGLRALGSDRISLEQGMDLLCQRTFRQTLLCHAGAEPRETPDSGVVRSMRMATPLRTAAGPAELRSSGPVAFQDAGGRGVSLDEPIAKAALFLLGRAWPATFAFDALLDGAASLLEVTADARARAEETLCEVVATLFQADLVELHAETPPFAIRAGDRPCASALIRLDAQEGRRTANLRHQRVDLDDPLAQRVIALLDGSRDRACLLEAFRGELDAADLESILDTVAQRALLLR